MRSSVERRSIFAAYPYALVGTLTDSPTTSTRPRTRTLRKLVLVLLPGILYSNSYEYNKSGCTGCIAQITTTRT
eukprot:scaffold34426_cov17-Prasinocladus_malaysianus.AAC.1